MPSWAKNTAVYMCWVLVIGLVPNLAGPSWVGQFLAGVSAALLFGRIQRDVGRYRQRRH